MVPIGAMEESAFPRKPTNVRKSVNTCFTMAKITAFKYFGLATKCDQQADVSKQRLRSCQS